MNARRFPCHYRADAAASGESNMQIDAQMLNAAVAGSATLRTYQWSVPTISLGHFQAKVEGAVPDRFAGLPVVERLSGGGAILHDQELTYSVALPKSHSLAQTPTQIYVKVHEAIIQVLSTHGISSQMRGDAAFAEKPFLCFGRGDERDIVIGDDKIVGSAQRRRQGAVLQHGSLLLRQSSHAAEFPGIQELTGVDLEESQLASELKESISERLNLELL